MFKSFQLNSSEGHMDTTVDTTTTGGDVSLMSGMWPIPHTSTKGGDDDDDDDLQLSGLSSLPSSIAVPL